MTMMLLGVLAMTLGLVASSPIPNTTTPAVPTTTPAVPTTKPAVLSTTPAVPTTTPAVLSTTTAVPTTTPAVLSTTTAIPGAVIAKSSVNEMLEEVEELFGDTQTKLENAVKELEAEESAKELASLKELQDLPSNYHNKTVKETKVGNATIVTKEEIIKETDNKTGSTYISKTVISSVKNGNKTEHECIVDEDCGPEKYCHLSSLNYKCQPCKEEETCTRDGECCEGRLCVWGQCRTSSKGRSGTICENQQDCGSGLCCAVHTSLLFPVCTPMPVKGEQCQTLDPLLELFPWELESEVPMSHCPCARGLVCRPESHGLVSVCEEPALPDTTRDGAGTTGEDVSLITPEPQDHVVYEDGLTAPTGSDLGASEDVVDRESELLPQFMDFI